MKTSIYKLLEREHTDRSETIYQANREEINNFCIAAGDFFRIEKGGGRRGGSWLEQEYGSLLDRKKGDRVYEGLCRQREAIVCEIRNIKEEDPRGYDHMEQLRALRKIKKELTEVLETLNRYYEEEAAQELLQKFGIRDRKQLLYKNTVAVGSFEDLEKQIPRMKKMSLSWVRETPLLLGNIQKIKEAVEREIPIGVVGGPCLFGTYEMGIKLRHENGEEFSYDFSTGRSYGKSDREEFPEHVEKYAKDIQEICFENRKQGVTSQEYDSLKIVFEFAGILGAKAVIPIPDISYLKYLSTSLAPLQENFKQQIMEKFRKEAEKTADFYLEVIEELKAEYPSVELKVLHGRDPELCREFYEKRERYFRKSGLIRRMTRKREKTDAVFDYISMLALPYYFFGTPQVIQVDNLDETDSYRKCRKVHKGVFSLSSVLYPERLSANGKDTIFHAPLEYKEYRS